MNPNDAPRFKELLTGVYSYYRIELSQFHIDVFWQALKSFDFGAVQDAFSRHVQNPDNGQFLPKVADIVKLIGGGTADRALLAWTKFEIAVQYVGSWDSVVFDDPIIHQVAEDMGGWTDLCAREEKEWPFVKNEFVQRYRGYANSRLLSYPSKLVGRIEAENGGRWPDAIPAPKFVGDEARARQVMLNGANAAVRRMKKIGELVDQATKALPHP
jgi:hypothetical protein